MIEDAIRDLPTAFSDHLSDSGIVFDTSTQIDLLASALGSQFLLLAGPSGTGKSTAAHMLSSFFAPDERRVIIDARPGWIGQEDLLGQYSSFAESYLGTNDLDELIQVANSSVASSPIVTIEEANLSPLESYLGPVITRSSSIAWSEVSFDLHRTQLGSPPKSLLLDKWPRFISTINVDSSAHAPAPKVAGRSCVVLLEPPTIEEAKLSVGAISFSSQNIRTAAFFDVLGDPRLAWASAVVNGEADGMLASLESWLTLLESTAGRGSNIVSPRSLQRSVMFIAWHYALSKAAGLGGMQIEPSLELSSENAVLHYLLPSLTSEQFARCLLPLLESASAGGLLAARLQRLLGAGEGAFGVPPDFWASLS